jgi:hypothetical protein
VLFGWEMAFLVALKTPSLISNALWTVIGPISNFQPVEHFPFEFCSFLFD